MPETLIRIAVLGQGTVGRALARRFAELGHEVSVGTRSLGTYGAAAAAGELVVNATAGVGSREALEAAGAENLAGKVILDVANVIERSDDGVAVGVPGGSLAEELQEAFPDARVVKALNTVNADVMIDPSTIPGEHVLFLCGDDADAKAQVRMLLEELGWPGQRLLDLGPLRAARAMEGYLLLWLGLMGVVGHAHFNIAVEVGERR